MVAEMQEAKDIDTYTLERSFPCPSGGNVSNKRVAELQRFEQELHLFRRVPPLPCRSMLHQTGTYANYEALRDTL